MNKHAGYSHFHLSKRGLNRVCSKPHRAAIQTDGQVAWQWAYSAFGEEKPTIAKNRFANADLNQSFGTTNVAAVTFNLRYPGQYFDQETGLHYNYHRSYSTTLGRYTQSDPIGLDGGWNRFGYAEQNPLEFTDPLGLDARCGGGKTAVATSQSGVYKCVDDGSDSNAKVCATAECAAGLLPAICDNRTIDEIDDSLDKSNCKRVCKPIVSSVMQVSPVPGSSYVAKKVICSKVCSK